MPDIFCVCILDSPGKNIFLLIFIAQGVFKVIIFIINIFEEESKWKIIPCWANTNEYAYILRNVNMFHSILSGIYYPLKKFFILNSYNVHKCLDFIINILSNKILWNSSWEGKHHFIKYQLIILVIIIDHLLNHIRYYIPIQIFHSANNACVQIQI